MRLSLLILASVIAASSAMAEAGKILMRRHPLDVMVSVISNHMTHGFVCAYELETAARHYTLIDSLVTHIRAQTGLNLIDIRYEDLVSAQQDQVGRALSHVGVAFEPACLRFHENRRYARTASYAQVAEKLYDRSIGRFRQYQKYLDPAMRILEPAIANGGYD